MADMAKIISDINEHVARSRRSHSDWYVGIATDIKQRLFGDHNVDQDGWWIYRIADDEKVARETEAKLLDEFGYDGGIGGGDHPIYVYAFLKTSSTRR